MNACARRTCWLVCGSFFGRPLLSLFYFSFTSLFHFHQSYLPLLLLPLSSLLVLLLLPSLPPSLLQPNLPTDLKFTQISPPSSTCSYLVSSPLSVPFSSLLFLSPLLFSQLLTTLLCILFAFPTVSFFPLISPHLSYLLFSSLVSSPHLSPYPSLIFCLSPSPHLFSLTLLSSLSSSPLLSLFCYLSSSTPSLFSSSFTSPHRHLSSS